MKQLYGSLGAIILIGAASSAPAFAGTEIRSQFKMNLDSTNFYSMLNNVMTDYHGDSVIPIPDISVTTPFTTTISGIQVTLHYTIPKPTQAATPRDWNISTNQLSADMTVGSLDASQVITIVGSDGSVLNLTVNATCTNIHLVLPQGSSLATGTVHASLVQNQVQLALTSFNASWIPGSWQVASMNCNGPQGFGQTVATELQKRLSTINPFLGQIQTGLQQQLNQIAATAVSTLFSSTPTGNGDLMTFVEPGNLSDAADGGVLLDSIIHFILPRVDMTVGGVIPFASAPASDPAISSFLIPYQTAMTLMAAGYWNGWYNTSFASDQLSGFTSLQHNRFGEWFVWPDLTNFDSSAIFQMQTWATSPPQFTKPVKTGDGQIGANVVLTTLVRMMGPHRDHPNLPQTPYVTFFNNVSGPGTIQVNNGQIVFQLPKPSLSMTYAFDASYLNEFNPNTKIDMKTIAPMLSSYLATTTLKYQLPPIDITPSIKITPTQLNLEDQNLRIYFTNATK